MNKRFIGTAVLLLGLAGSAAAQVTAALYEDNNPAPAVTGTIEECLTVLDKALGANAGNGYGRYAIRAVVSGNAAVPSMKLSASGTSDYTVGDTANNGLTFANLGRLKHPLSITVTSDGPQPTLSLSEKGSMFYLDKLNVPVTMTIDNVILKGLSAGHLNYKIATYASFTIDIPASSPAIDNNNSLLYVGQGNSFEMLGSAELTGNWNAGASGSNGAGGAARVASGIFLMTGDNTRVHHNYASQYVGGIYCEGRLIMSGENAEVSYNAGGTSSAGGIGGLLADGPNGYFELSGSHAKVNWNQGGNKQGGGGVQTSTAGTVAVMSGDYAEISHNYTLQAYGGGLFVGVNTQFTMSGAHAAIKENTAPSATLNTYGGGVFVRGSFFMEAGEISGNYATYDGPFHDQPNVHNNLDLLGTAPVAQFTGSKAWIGDVPVPTGDMRPSLIYGGYTTNNFPELQLWCTLGGGALRAEK
jgi:hypothetical protein